LGLSAFFAVISGQAAGLVDRVQVNDFMFCSSDPFGLLLLLYPVSGVD
jgi:hypothetical protein